MLVAASLSLCVVCVPFPLVGINRVRQAPFFRLLAMLINAAVARFDFMVRYPPFWESTLERLGDIRLNDISSDHLTN